jgi:Ethanolamine utilization protein EutJ (predicted chaperonin)
MLALLRYSCDMIRGLAVGCVLAAAIGAFPLSLSGRVVGVDYTNAIVVVRTSAGDKTVDVTPSTDIDEPSGAYATIADIHRGSLVDVGASVIGGRIVAQYIRIR